MKRIQVSIEDLVNYWIEEKEGRHRSEISEFHHYADGQVEISMVDKEFAEDVLKYIDSYMSGSKAKYLRNLVHRNLVLVDINESYSNKSETDPMLASLGDCQSLATENIMRTRPTEHVKDEDQL